MTLTQVIARNTSLHFIGKIASLFLGLAAFGLIARHLGRVGFGQFTIVTSYLQAFGILADLGLYLIFVQLISLPGADINKIISNVFTLRFFSSLILLALAPIVALFIPQYSAVVKIGIAITALSFLCGSLIQLLTGFFQKKLAVKKVVIAEIAGRIVLIVFVLAAIWLKLGLLAILGAVILGGIANFFILYMAARRYVKISFQFDFNFWRQVLKKSWPIALSIIFTTIYFKGDTVILSLFKKPAEVGIYGAAYRILEVLIMFPPIFMGLVLPFLTNSWATRNLERFKRIFQKSFDFLIIIILPLIVGTLFLAKPIMVFIAGNEFGVSAGPLKVLMLATGLIFLGNLATFTIIAIEKQRQMLWRYLATAIIALTGYLIFIPLYSYWGAAYMTIVAETLTVFFAFSIIWREARLLPSLKIFWRSLAASLIMGSILFIFGAQNLFLLIILSIFIYSVSLYLLRGISQQTIREIRG